jgi:plastocyanin
VPSEAAPAIVGSQPEAPKRESPQPIQLAQPPAVATVTTPVVEAPQSVNTPPPVPTAPPIQTFTIAGSVKVLGGDGVLDPQGTIIRLHRSDGEPIARLQESQRHVMDMEEKIYAPGNMVINTGDSVSFVNKDKIRHNVFSSSGENAFDLGTYGAGLQRGVTLKSDGIVKIYCNIHPKMAAFVAVDETGISRLASVDGQFQFDNLPSGDYQISVWNVRGELTRAVSLNSESVDLALTLDTSKYKPAEHANKFGEEYPDDAVSGEFY